MKSFNLIVSIAFVAIICACEKEGTPKRPDGTSGSHIKLGDIRVGSILTKSDLQEQTSGKIERQDVFLTVTQTDCLMDCLPTKADATTTSTLGNFRLDGYLDKEIIQKPAASDSDKQNLHFMSADAVKSGVSNGYWQGSIDPADTYSWRFGVHHHFWAVYPSSNSLTVDPDDFSKAYISSYEPDCDEDLLVAYTNQYYGKDEEAASTKQDVLGLVFKHALTAVNIDVSNLTFKEKASGSTAIPITDPTRCEILSYYVRDAYDKGDCAIDGDSISWSNLSSTSEIELATGEPQFLIPQMRDSLMLYIIVRDNQRELTRPYTFKASSLFSSGSWLPGHLYGYNFTGAFVVPTLPPDVRGIDASFAGKPFQKISLIEDISVKYIKKVKISWEGLPGGNSGNGTFAFLSIESGSNVPTESNYLDSSNSPNTSNSNIGFIYDYKTNSLLKGDAITDGDHCSCTVEFPASVDSITVYAAYIGSNNSGTCNWKLHNLKFEVLEWR